ncbi:MAG: fibronectin type III domain-containing protein [Thermodesulfobacteriota bacterium]|nr:fibronectin type III domain-containing protein [Thermodesulfobacteriota bacterium]
MKRGKAKDKRFVFLLSLALFMVQGACGVKGPPRLPQALLPPPVTDLEAASTGHGVRLTWSVPKKGDQAGEGITGFKVYGSQALDAGSPCAGCPIPFSERLDVRRTGPEAKEGDHGRVACHVTVTPGHCYAFKVMAYDACGGVSEDSNIVEVTVE